MVEDIRDVIAIENTGHYKGHYHVLGGIISPIDGVGPKDLNIDSLEQKVQQNKVKEIIFALSATMEADTTNFFIYKVLAPYDVKTSIAEDSSGHELESDEVTLGRSIQKRVPYENSIVNK